MTSEQRKKIEQILKENEFGVVATFPRETSSAPESSVVAISETEDLCIVFGSFRETRKNQNLYKNPLISVVVGWDNEKKQTLQVEGSALPVTNLEEKVRLLEAHCLKNQGSLRYKDDPRQEYFKIVPHWIRFSDFSKDPQEVWEVLFDESGLT